MEDQAARIARRARKTIFSALLDARRKYGGKSEILIDADDRRLTYDEVVRAAFALGRSLARDTAMRENVGLLLPTSAGAVISLFALHAYGRTPAMLNFTAGARNIKAACRAGQIKTIVTSRKFIDIAKLDKLAAALSEDARLIYLEDVKDNLTLGDKIAAVAGGVAPWLVRARTAHNEPGVILFTSGTEGDPKGVVLSHSNVVANVVQINGHVTLEPTDIIFNPLPTFHCYGLTAGALFPMLSGRPLVLHPSPLQTKIIPQRIKETKATILFATDTFLQQYMRASEDDALMTLRYAVCGAERVRDETRATARRRFGLEVLEGYGVTEASPVLAANQPGDIRPGTVGRMLPGIETRLDPVEGMDDAGRLFVRGPNVMRGYLLTDRPGEIQDTDNGWHDTGDVVSISDGGYVSIRGRAKRFANIGGELVSLAVVENCASSLWPDLMHAAVVLPDKRKGEQIVLVTEYAKAERAPLLAWAQSHGVNELSVPKKIVTMEEIPLLGTGKTDYVGVTRHAVETLAREGKPTQDEAA